MSFLRDNRGQVLLVIALMMTMLILAAGLAVDGGNAFVARSRLSKSVDAACLAGMKNLSQGQSTASTIATHIFNANYGSNPPTPTITFPTDANGQQQVQVAASSQVPTTFAKLLFPYWTVADVAVATRGKLVMSLVLDKSGSMSGDGGMTALKSAVPTFVNYFDDNLDYVALITFGSNSAINFPMAHTFKTTITNDVNALSAAGGTFGSGGTYVATDGPPMTLADNQINTIPVIAGANVVRVMVYFTDGLVNTVQDSFTCYTSATNHVTAMLNYGGYDPGTNEVDVFKPLDGTDWCPSNGGHCVAADSACLSGPNPACQIVYDSSGHVCQNPYNTNVTTFTSAQSGHPNINRANVTAEAQYRALQTANAMRGETPGIYIFTIGLGNGVSTSTQTFLKEVANDPSSPTYNSSLPQGEFFYVPDCPSSNCTTELQTAFQVIASKVLLRLTQ